jgi:hypothetical protein
LEETISSMEDLAKEDIEDKKGMVFSNLLISRDLIYFILKKNYFVLF